MKAFFKIVLACFFAILLFIGIGFLMFFGVIAGSSSNDEAVVLKNSVLRLDMSEPIKEQGEKNSIGFLTGAPSSVLGLNELLKSIESAKTDDKIKGIYIKLGMNPNGWATLQELRAALIDFKSSKKFIYAYGEICDQKSYYIASAGNQIYLNPVGGLEFKGLSITGMFYKGAIDKLDIKTEAFHCGKFKSAHEPYSRENFSEPNKLQLQNLLNDLYNEFLLAVSQKSGMDTASIRAMANNGMVKFPKDALQNKLIDATLYSDSVESIIRSKLALEEKEKIHFVNPADYANSVDEGDDEKDKIAVLYADGAIYDGESSQEIFSSNYVKHIRKIAKDKNIKAVVLRINSPGGSALASEIIYHELEILSKKKPLIASMGNYAASGGYYIACAADSIFAEKNTLTGSIGVVGVLFNFADMMKNKLGVTTDQVKTGQYADFPNVTRTMSDAERTWIQSYLDTTYNLFKSRVSTARHFSLEQVEELAQGHVNSGTTAKGLKLIDDFGNVKRALSCAANKAGLKKYSVVEYPKSEDQFEEMLSSLSGKKREEATLKKILGEDYTMYTEIQKLRNKQNMIQMVMPWVLEIK